MSKYSFETYLKGDRLYGPDLSLEQKVRWYEAEKEAYAELTAPVERIVTYKYHALNSMHGFNRIPDVRFEETLGYGSFRGDEFLPVLNRLGRVTIMEPSKQAIVQRIQDARFQYVTSPSYGSLPFPDNYFDFICCLGVLHHLPDVDKIISEFFRCSKKGGYILIREPTYSMGDWRFRRAGLTSYERGIPIRLLREMIIRCKFKILNEKRCMFSPILKIQHFIRAPLFNIPFVVWLDCLLCSLTKNNEIYHAIRPFHKIRPLSAFFVATKV